MAEWRGRKEMSEWMEWKEGESTRSEGDWEERRERLRGRLRWVEGKKEKE